MDPPAQTTSMSAPVTVQVSTHVDEAVLPRFYAAANAFVLPSRGEGWGRPHVEVRHVGHLQGLLSLVAAAMLRGGMCLQVHLSDKNAALPLQAMSMGLPVIATNWSGPMAFLDEVAA